MSYADPLFIELKPRFTDDGLMGGSGGGKSSPKYHDRERTLKILNGLCFDIFFRADDTEDPEYKTIPECSVPVPGYFPHTGTVDYRKPLDSPYKKRTYTISKELPAPAVKKTGGPGGPKQFQVRRRRRRR